MSKQTVRMQGGTELQRIERVNDFLKLEQDIVEELKDITLLANEICQTPISLITLLDEDTTWIKAAYGISYTHILREVSFCDIAIKGEEVYTISDAKQEDRFQDNIYVHGEDSLRFYAGAPLITSDGLKLGTLCVLDAAPNSITETQKQLLKVLSRQVIYLLESKLAEKALYDNTVELEQKNEILSKVAKLQSHDIRQPLTTILGLIELVDNGAIDLGSEWLYMMKEAANVLDGNIRSIVNESLGDADIKISRFNKMVEEIEDYAILLLDKDGTIENWNKGAEKIKGYKVEEIVGQNFRVFYIDEQQEQGLPEQLLEEAIEKGVARSVGPRVRKDKTTFYASVLITAIHDSTGQVIGFTKVTRDITSEVAL